MRIGIDLGGTKIEAVALSEQGLGIYRHRIPTPANDYDTTVAAVVALIHEVEKITAQQGRVGIGTPGAVSHNTGLMKNCNSTCINNQNLQADIEALLGRQVRLANDANCFALSEAVDGSGANHPLVFGVILGTGVGGGMVLNKQLIRGRNSIGGEWGHNVMPGLDAGQFGRSRPCYCGRADCIETYLSGPGMASTYSEMGGQAIAALQIVERAEQGEALALEVLHVYRMQLAMALAQLINILDPDVVVLGGGLSNIRSLYQGITDCWQAHVFGDRIDTPLLPALHGDASGVRGAAWLHSK